MPPAADIAGVAGHVENLFRPTSTVGTQRIGVELEQITFEARADEPHAVVAAARLRAILATDPDLSAEARFSIEPGGQLELSPAPSANARELVDNLHRLVTRTRELLGRQGIGLASAPVDPWRTTEDLGLQTPAERYRAMQRHFDAIGTAGRRMMRQTASLQLCLDLLPGQAGRGQWLVANLAGPALAAAFTRVPTTGPSDTRLSIWQSVDPSRTARHETFLDLIRPAFGYLAFALAAEVMPLHRADGGNNELPFRTSFHDWMGAGGSRPDLNDFAHHLTTLFPPVRPRGYLEVRYIDVQPAEWLSVPIVLLTTLLYDHHARNEAIDLLGADPGGQAGWWSRAAADPKDPALRAIAAQLFEIGARRARAFPVSELPAHGPDLVTEFARQYLWVDRAPAASASIVRTAQPIVNPA